MIFRTVFRETCSSRQISLIVLPRTKNSRRTLAIVSTPFIPHPPIQFKGRAGLLELTKGGQFWTPIPPLRGSTFHADPHTSLAGGAGRAIYERLYCARGEAENHIKAWKAHLAADRTSCTSAAANQLRLFMHAGAYWLMW